jgi:tRNA G26 N,N-dimethylase Trm1
MRAMQRVPSAVGHFSYHSDISHEFRALMYSQRTAKTNVDVVDLDPYGTAAPFIDGAVQCVVDNGQWHICVRDIYHA